MPRPFRSDPPAVAYLGMDPGRTGGLTAILPGRTIAILTPETETDIWDWVRQFRPGSLAPYNVTAAFCEIEWINPAIQKVSKSNMSKLYGSYMALRMACVAARIPFETVQPQKWQPQLGVEKRRPSETDTKWKERLKGYAQRLFPDLECWQWRLVEERRAVADSILIAEQCRRRFTGAL
jgi:hypothetical protein